MNINAPFLGEGFSLITGALLERYPKRVPAAPGVYALLVKDGHSILRKSGYDAAIEGAPWRIAQYVHLYTGESFDLRWRVSEHLAGCPVASNFKLSLLALQYGYRAIWPEYDPRVGHMDTKLRRFLVDNLLIAFKRADFIGELEADLIRRSRSPLNLRCKPQGVFSRDLSRLRAKFRKEKLEPIFP